MNSTYWPARYLKATVAGSCSLITITSGAARVSAATRAGIFSGGYSPAPATRAGLDDAIGLRRGTAGQDPSGLFLCGGQGLGLVHAVDHAAFDEAALA